MAHIAIWIAISQSENVNCQPSSLQPDGVGELDGGLF